MLWPDISRWVWSYVIYRLKVFTNLDASKLELSATSLSVADVEIDHERIPIPGVEVKQFIASKLTVDLTSTGLAIGASGVNVDAVITSLEPPDLAISRIIEHARTDIEGYGGGDMSTVKSRFADFALSQVRSHVTDISATLRYPNDDLVIHLHIDQIAMNQKHRIELESIVVTRGNANNSDSDSFSESSSTDSLSDDDEGNENDDSHNHMARSVLFKKPGSLIANSSLVKSVYFDALEGSKTHSLKEDEELGTIDRAIFTYSVDPMEFSLDIDKMRLDGFVTLETVVETLNLLWKSSIQAQDGSKGDSKSEFSVGTLEIHESLADASLAPVTFTNIRLKDETLDVESLDVPGVVSINPFLTAVTESGRVKADMMMPVSISLGLDAMPYVERLASRIYDIISGLEPPADPQPTPVDIHLSEFRLAIGQDFTLLIFPESLSNSGFALREVLLTASEGQLLIRNISCESKDQAGSLKGEVEELRVRFSTGFVEELSTIVRLLSGDTTGLRDDETRHWRSLDLPDTYWKVASLVVEDAAAVLLQGDLELRTVHLNADVRASLSLEHPNAKASCEVSAYSNDGLMSIESSISVFDCDAFLEKYTGTDSSTLRSPALNENKSASTLRRMPQIRTKLDFGNGIRLHFPDEHKSVFAVCLNATELVISHDGAISVVVPELFVKLEDVGGDVSLLKMQNLTASHCSDSTNGTETVINVRRAALATCPDTYSLISQLPVLVLPPPAEPHYAVDPDASVDIFKDVVDTRFRSEELKTQREEELTLTLESIDIKQDYLINRSTKTKVTDGVGGGAKSSTLRIAIKLAQWQMFDGFDLERTRKSISEAIQRVEAAASDANESDRDLDDDEEERIVVGDYMYNSLFVVAQGANDGKLLSTKVADELGGQGYDRSLEPKLTLTLRKAELEHCVIGSARSQLSITIRDGKVIDTVPTSAFSYLLSPMEPKKQKFLVYTQETVGSEPSPELRVKFALQPLHLQLDQDTVEFLNRFFQFSINDETTAAALAERSAASSATFLQRLEFVELPLLIDYTPKKVDYRSLRSGVAAELVNLFVVKGAKLTLKPGVLHGISGWDRAFQELAGLWAPDIRANQLSGLLSGIGPVRQALKLGKGIKSWAIVPMRSKRTGQVTKGAGLVVRRTVDELLRLRTAWLDSADKALGGESPDATAPRTADGEPLALTQNEDQERTDEEMHITRSSPDEPDAAEPEVGEAQAGSEFGPLVDGINSAIWGDSTAIVSPSAGSELPHAL